MFNLAIILAVVSLGSPLAVAGPADPPAPRSNPASAPPTNSLPPKIITTDGVVYNAPRLSRVEPDGLLVEFRPDAGGTGLAKLKFAKLPESLQKQFAYDPRKAADFEHDETLAMQELTQKLQADERARSAALALHDEQARPPNLSGAVTVTASEPVITYEYYTPDRKPALLGSNHVATCQHTYPCHADFDVHVQEGAAGEPVHFSMDKVRISLGMTCRIIEPLDPYDIVRQSGEGRREILEYFYRLAPLVANAIGASMVGREFTSTEVNFENAKKRALADAEAQIVAVYNARIESVFHEADLYYSQLTDHGLNSMDRNQAAKEVCDKFGKLFLDPAHPVLTD